MFSLTEDHLERCILDLLAGSVLWRALTHHDLAIAILKAWPTFQFPPQEEPTVTTGWLPGMQRTPQQIWHLPPARGDVWEEPIRWLGYYENSTGIATRAVLFHLRHSRHALAQLVAIAGVCKRWYCLCQAWIPEPTMLNEPRTFPLQLGLHRNTQPFQANNFLPLPVDPYLHATDHYLFQLALAALERVQAGFGRLDPVDETAFPLSTLNYFRRPAGGAAWVSYVLIYKPHQFRRAQTSLYFLWFLNSHPIERLAPGQIMPLSPRVPPD